MAKKNWQIDINYDWCKACELCVNFCPTHVYETDGAGRPKIVDLVACTGCQLCVLHCPDFCIEVRESGDQ